MPTSVSLEKFIPKLFDASMRRLLNLLKRRRKGPSRLLDLPPELQLIIYEYVLTYPSWISVLLRDCQIRGYCEDKKAHGFRHCHERRRWRTHLALTRVNRYLRNTTLKMYYQRNVFRVDLEYSSGLGDRADKFVRWLRLVGPEYRPLICVFVFDKEETNLQEEAKVYAADFASQDSVACLRFLRWELDIMGGTLTREHGWSYQVTLSRRDCTGDRSSTRGPS